MESCLTGVYRVKIQTGGATHDFASSLVSPYLAFEQGGIKFDRGLTRVKNHQFQVRTPRARGRRKVVAKGKASYGPTSSGLPRITGPVQLVVKVRGRKAQLKGTFKGTSIDFNNGRVYTMQGTITSRPRRVRC